MESVSFYDDKELFQLIAEGDKEAFTALVKKYSPQLSSFLSGLTKSDSITDENLQEIFMRIWFNREKLIGINEPASYIFRIAAAVSFASLKKILTEATYVNTVHYEFSYADNDVFETARLYTLVADIQLAIKHLTPQQKKVYKMNREKGMKVPEIAEEISLSPNNVRTLLNSSVESIHDHLQHKGHSIVM